VMVAVAEATRNAEMVARERADRTKAQLKALNGPIQEARVSAQAAQKAVDTAEASLALTRGNRERARAKEALNDAKVAVQSANEILESEIGQRDAVLSNRLQSDKGRLAGENEIHYRARKTYHRGNRVLKMVSDALQAVHNSHAAHKKAAIQRQQEIVTAQATALAAKEKSKKSEERRKARGIKTNEEYAAKLADEALTAGERAEAYMKKAATAGTKAAQKIMEAAEVKSDLYDSQAGVATTGEGRVAQISREASAALLASQASQMEAASVGGHPVQSRVPVLVAAATTTEWHVQGESLQEEVRRARKQAQLAIPTDRDIERWAAEKPVWKAYYKKLYQAKLDAVVKNQKRVADAVQRKLAGRISNGQ